MRAVLCNSFDGIKALSVGETAEPPGADRGPDRRSCRLGQLHGLSDDLRRLPDATGSPLRTGTDAAGVVSPRRKVKRFGPGDRVACEDWFGGFAERMTAKASKTCGSSRQSDFIVGSTSCTHTSRPGMPWFSFGME